MSSESSDKSVKVPSKKTDENTETSKKDELERLKLRLGFAKFAITLFFGTVLTSLLSFFINYKEVQITAKENELQLQLAEREELANYFRYTMEGDIYDRLKLSSFFGNVITDRNARRLWEEYYAYQEALLGEYKQWQIDNQEFLAAEEGALLVENQEEYARFRVEQKRFQELVDPISIDLASSASQSDSSSNFTGIDLTNYTSVQLPVPYFSQMDNETKFFGAAWRQDNATVNAMLADFLLEGALTNQAQQEGKPEAESVYMEVVSRHGDTIDHSAQTKALKEFGIESYFSRSLSREDVLNSLKEEIPVVVGTAYKSSGHMIILVGFDPQTKSWIAHDPYGIRVGASDTYDVGAEAKFVAIPDTVMQQIFWDMGAEAGWGRIVTSVNGQPTGLATNL